MVATSTVLQNLHIVYSQHYQQCSWWLFLCLSWHESIKFI